jgi:hypothetical protein
MKRRRRRERHRRVHVYLPRSLVILGKKAAIDREMSFSRLLEDALTSFFNK